MQFSCESCKTQLQIADEKVRGKRLIVRCKRCGAKIGISDPALGAPKAPLRPAGSAPPPQASAPPAVSKPAPAAAAAPAARAAKRDSDTESTLAIDSDLLERALQASKNDDPSIAPNGAPSSSEQRAAAPAPAPAAAPAPGEEAIWFAMLHGKQTGPMTVPELTGKANDGTVGPRTYLWKDGMDAWQRAKDIGELQALFPQAPAPPPPPPPAAPVGQGMREFSTPDFVAPVASAPPPAASEPPKAAEAKADGKEEERTSVDPLPFGERVHQESVAKELFASGTSGEHAAAKADLAGWAANELEKKPPPPSAAPRAVMFASTAPPQSKAPFVMIAVVIALAVAAGALWYFYGSGTMTAPPKKDEAVAPVAPKPPEKPAAAEKPPEKQAVEKPAEKPPEKKPEPVPTGLTADQVRKKLDENKGALQGCIDEALRRDPNLRVGKIHIATTIAPSGQVTTAKIDKATVDQSPLGACLRRATRRIAFPPFTGDAFDVDIPIVVTAGD